MATQREGGQVKFYPTKRWGTKGFRHAEGGGGTTTFEVVLTQEFSVSHIDGGRVKFPPFNRGGREKFNPLLRPAISPFCSPPTPLPPCN